VHDSAAYVLGALSPAERSDYERHMAECPICRTDVAELAVLPGLLGRLDVTAAEQAAAQPGGGVIAEAVPPVIPGARAGVYAESVGERLEMSPDSLPTLLAAARRTRARDRRRRRWQTVSATLVAACAAVLATIGIGSLHLGSQPAQPAPPALVAMQSTGSGVPMSAEIALRATSDGTQIRMHCHYDVPSQPGHEPGSERYTFRLFGIPKDGGVGQELSSWDASFGDDMNFSTTTNVRLSDMQRVELRKNDGRSVILTYDVA
jgi:hypothetical protein